MYTFINRVSCISIFITSVMNSSYVMFVKNKVNKKDNNIKELDGTHNIDRTHFSYTRILYITTHTHRTALDHLALKITELMIFQSLSIMLNFREVKSVSFPQLPNNQ